MKKMTTVLIFVFCLTSLAFAEDDFIFTPYYCQKAHLYTDGNNSYSETYSSWGIEAAYFINSFLIGYIKAETGSLISAHTKDGLELKYSGLFPGETASRKLYALGAGTAFYFYTNPENIFYFGLEYNHIMLKPINYLQISYPSSEKNLSALAFSLGDRFLLFPSLILNLEVNFAFPLSRIEPPLQDNSTHYTFFNYFISLRLGIGILY